MQPVSGFEPPPLTHNESAFYLSLAPVGEGYGRFMPAIGDQESIPQWSGRVRKWGADVLDLARADESPEEDDEIELVPEFGDKLPPTKGPNYLPFALALTFGALCLGGGYSLLPRLRARTGAPSSSP